MVSITYADFSITVSKQSYKNQNTIYKRYGKQKMIDSLIKTTPSVSVENQKTVDITIKSNNKRVIE